MRLLEPSTGRDLTGRMAGFAARRVRELDAENLSGFVLKADSPSCGSDRVKVWNRRGPPRKAGVGVFAEVLLRCHPFLPVEEEGGLRDERTREEFLRRMTAYRRVRNLFRSRWRKGDLVRFLDGEEAALRTADPKAPGKLRRLVAGRKGKPRRGMEEAFLGIYMGAFFRP